MITSLPEIAGVRVSEIATRQGVNEQRVAVALREAHRLIRAGWTETVPWCDEAGQYPTDNPTRYSLVSAIRSSHDDALVCDYAVRVVREVVGEHDLHRWARNPVRTQVEILRAMEPAISASGGRAPRRGGW